MVENDREHLLVEEESDEDADADANERNGVISKV